MPTTQSPPSLGGFPEVDFAASLFPGLTEAENLSIASGFSVVSNPHASAGSYLQATAATSRAGGVFEGPVGLYDINLSYFDETDGVSYMEVLVNGALVAAFDWDATGGGCHRHQGLGGRDLDRRAGAGAGRRDRAARHGGRRRAAAHRCD
ncbi:hypothetical protein [Alloyangia mangrovi]|uniref:hypothetical protein n=1 Tax=Alloyangia mangrovi TaxID=1779329 RepID=UPI0021A7E60B|nr:hypothetical protein [Alloyangia mangrovi]